MLKSPEHLSSLPLEELENLVRHYPWFSLGQTLLAKAYKDQNTYKFSDQLSLASTLSSNRNWLYTFIKNESRKPEVYIDLVDDSVEILQEDVLVHTPEAPILNHRFESLHSLAEKIVDEEDHILELSQPQIEENPEELSETSSESEIEYTEELELSKTDEPVSRTATEGMDLLDKSILATAVSSAIYMEVGEEEANEEQDSSTEIKHATPSELEEEISEDPFIQWLQLGSNEQPKLPEVSTSDLENTQALIDKFIATEPKITPGKAEQYTGVSFAQTSLDDNFEWVTETMAKLYAVQGKVDRARKAYKRLIELHPEKKTYFENQLKALNQRK